METKNTNEASEKYVIALMRGNKVVGYHLSDDQDVVKDASKAAIHNSWRQAEIEAGLNNDQWDLKSNEKFTILPLSHAKTLKMSVEQDQSTEKLENAVRSVLEGKTYTQDAIANVLKKNKYIEVSYDKIDDVAAKDEVFGETISAIGVGKSDRTFYKKFSGDTIAVVVRKNGTVSDPSDTDWGKDGIGDFFDYYNIKA